MGCMVAQWLVASHQASNLIMTFLFGVSFFLCCSHVFPATCKSAGLTLQIAQGVKCDEYVNTGV